MEPGFVTRFTPPVLRRGLQSLPPYGARVCNPFHSPRFSAEAYKAPLPMEPGFVTRFTPPVLRRGLQSLPPHHPTTKTTANTINPTPNTPSIQPAAFSYLPRIGPHCNTHTHAPHNSNPCPTKITHSA